MNHRVDRNVVVFMRFANNLVMHLRTCGYVDDNICLESCLATQASMFIKAAPNSFGFVNPRDIEELWRDQFDWVYREYDYAVFTMTIHPDVSGRPQVQLMLERVFEHIASHAGVRFCTFDEIADDFRQRYPREAGAAAG